MKRVFAWTQTILDFVRPAPVDRGVPDQLRSQHDQHARSRSNIGGTHSDQRIR